MFVDHLKKIKKAGDSQYLYQNERDKACFQQYMAYREFKDLTRRTVSDKILHDKAFNITKSPKYDGYQRNFASMVYNFYDKKTAASAVKNEKISD